MGFGRKKTVTVSSTLYNLAGPEEDRPNFLTGSLFTSVMSGSDSIADDITNSYFEGPGIKQRQLFGYADRNNIAGLPSATVTNSNPVDESILVPVIGAPEGLEVIVQKAEVNDGDVEPFIERYILENHPLRISEEWVGDAEGTDLSVQFPNGDFFQFEDLSYSSQSRYIVASYFLVSPATEDPLVEGANEVINTLPDLTGWVEQSSTDTFTNVTLQRTSTTTRTYNDDTPTETDAPVDADVIEPLNTSVDVFERTDVVGVSGYETENLFQRYTLTGDDQVIGGYEHTEVTTTNLPGGVVETSTTVTTGEQIQDQWILKSDTQSTYNLTVIGSERRFIYEVGTGEPTLDALATEADSTGFQEFFPFLPIRINNVSITDDKFVDNGLFAETKAAYRRTTKESFNKIVDAVEDNDAIGDIDYAYVMFGCSLNVQEQACRRYIFNFFDEMRQFQNSDATSLSDFQSQIVAYDQAQLDVIAWEAEVNSLISQNAPSTDIPPRPIIPPLKLPESTTLNLRTSSTLMPSYDIRLYWTFIEDEQFEGNFTFNPLVGDSSPAKKGQVQFVVGPDFTWTEKQGADTRGGSVTYDIPHSLPSIEMYHQVSDTQYRRITIYGLIHYNFIYGSKGVRITSTEAMEDNDISGFVIPLHFPTVKAMSIVDYTQMATANTFILFNSYEIVKQKWYQTLLFKIIIIIIIIIITVLTYGAGGLAASGGLLGTNAAVGATLGLTGTAAIVAGAVANFIAGIIVAQILSKVGSEVLGEKYGAIFAAAISLAITFGASGTSIISAEGLLAISNAVANGYAGFVQGELNEMQKDIEAETSDYEKRMEAIDDLIAGLGGNNLNFNPLSLTDSVYGNDSSNTGSGSYLPETSEEFIRRTTMTGSDVVELTHSMVYNFVDIQNTLPRN